MKIEGLAETKAKLLELGEETAAKMVQQANREACKVILDAAKKDAPIRSGQTLNALKIRGGKAANGVCNSSVGVSKRDYSGRAFYAAFVIYGHKIGKRPNKKGRSIIQAYRGDQRKSVAGDNWLGRAYDESAENALQAFVDSLTQQLNAETGGT